MEKVDKNEFQIYNNNYKNETNKKLFDIVPKEDLNREQYFFSENFINSIYTSFNFISRKKILCLCTPAISTYFKIKDEEKLINSDNLDEIEEVEYTITLDSDNRFKFLPNFYLFDLNKPKEYISTSNLTSVSIDNSEKILDQQHKNVDLISRDQLNQIEYIFFDPPFFQIKPNELRLAVDSITNKDYTKKIFITYPIREANSLIFAFKDYNIRKSKLKVEYQFVKSSKWENYALYTNFEIQKIKFE
jgi:hypothetical protein